MSRSLISTAPGTSANYETYLYDSPVKDDRDGDAILLDFTLAATDVNFVRLSRGNYVKYTTNTYGVWATGYITNEPEYTYLGAKNNQPHWGYKYQVSSDEIILSQNALGIIQPFLNQTQGAILQALAEKMQPGLFDYSNVQPGLTLARYVVDPTKKFSDVALDFCNASVYRCFGKDHKLYFVPKPGLSTTLTVDGTDLRFTPADLVVKASIDAAICNDCLVMGNLEPQRYTSEYFVGDGFTGEFPLSSSVFGTDSALLLDDAFTGSSFDNTKWTVYDEPVNYIQLFNGYVNVVGGTGDSTYPVHLDSENLLPLSGAMRLAHGEYDFVPQTTDNLICGVICGLWTQEPNSSFNGCVYGLRVKKVGGEVLLHPIANGVVDLTQFQSVQTNGATANVPLWNVTVSYTEGQLVNYLGIVYVCLATTAPGDLPTDTGFWAQNVAKRYVIRTIVSTTQIMRVRAQYNFRLPGGGTGTYGGGVVGDNLTVTTYITELDPNTGEITPGFPKSFVNPIQVTSTQAYALYIPVASNDLHVTFTGVTISTPMQASLTTVEDGPGGFIGKLVGPNEIDATDGLAPYATIATSGAGVSMRQNILGTPQYNFGSPTLEFFKDSAALTTTVPQQGDIIRLVYRSAGAAMGRARSQSSVNLESANWGDNGVRSVVQTNGVVPQPQTSADCESAAAAVVGQNSYTHYEGTYTIVAQNTQGEPVAGSGMQFKNLPLRAFPVDNFNEPMTEVVTNFNATSQGEQFVHAITFGLKGNSQRLLQTLAGFQLQTDVFTTTDTAQTPDWVPPSALAMAYAADVTNPGLDFTNNGTYGAWQAGHVYSLGTVILDANNNLQTVVVAGMSGTTAPTFASLINTAGELGATFTAAQVQITSNVVTITSLTDLTGVVNIGAKVSIGDMTACTDLNGLVLTATSISGVSFQANINHVDYALAGDSGTAIVTAVGTVKPISVDNAVQWQLVGHSYGVDANNIYFDAGQIPTLQGLLPNIGGYGADGYGVDPYGESRNAIPGVGFEVRYTDDSWGCDAGKNLAGRFTTELFSLPRNQRNSVVFIRAFDGRNIIPSSENWLPSSFNPWFCTGTFSQVYGNDPDGNKKLLNQVVLGNLTGSSVVTPAYTFAAKTSMSLTVSVKGPAGSSVLLYMRYESIGGAAQIAAQAFVLTGQWQRVTLPATTTIGGTDGFVVGVLGAATGSVTVLATRASLELNTTQETIYCKTKDATASGGSSVYGANSRFGGSVHVGYPLVPPSPTGFVDPTDISNPIVNLILPPVAQDVWGIEIRASDNSTVLYSANLTDAGFAPAYTWANGWSRNLSFYLYTYNLLGEYSAAYNLTYTIPTPSITSVSVDEVTKSLNWTSAHASSYSVEIDNTDETMSSIILSDIRAMPPKIPLITATSVPLSDPDFFNLRWFRIIPYDVLGPGTGIGSSLNVANNNFDQSTIILPPPGWQNGGAPGGTLNPATLSYDTVTPHNGVASLVVTSATLNFAGVTALVQYTVVPGEMYTITAAVKSFSGAEMVAQLSFFDNTGTRLSDFTNVSNTTTTWVKSTSAPVVVPTGAVTMVIELYIKTVGSGEVDAVGVRHMLNHQYIPAQVVEFNGNEAKYVAPPSTPTTDVTLPTFGGIISPVEFINQSWADYKTNTER